LTGISTAAVSASAAVAGAILSRKFGHGVKTDGFFAAYAVYVALVLVANALRVVVLPRFARAHSQGLLGREVGTWSLALAVPLVPAVVVAVAAPHALAGLLTGSSSARHQAAELLPWLVPAAAAQVYAGVAASALGALDDYGTAAFGFAAGAVAGLVAIVALVGHGVQAFGWGLALNGGIALLAPLTLLVARGCLGWPE
jgi:O-antigen/teichoic acid export membrane protein